MSSLTGRGWGVAGCGAFGQLSGVVGSEVGPVAGEGHDPLVAGLVGVGRDQVGGVGLASAGHADVGRRGAGVLAEDEVCCAGGGALRAVRGCGVGEFDMSADVAGGQDSLTFGPARDGQPPVALDAGDGPGVAVGHVQVAVVAACRDLIPDPDPLTRPGGHLLGVIDHADGEEPVADRGVQRADLLAGIDYHRNRLACPVPGGDRVGDRCMPLGLARMQADLAAAMQGVEYRFGPLRGPHQHGQLRVVGVGDGGGAAVGVRGLAGEAVHHVQGHAGVRVGPAGSEVQDTSAADRGHLIPVTEEGNPDPAFVGDC